MHHLYPLAKGDPLCPLGFHPQVRWPTRCKRCFRDYKEHGGRKREDDFAASTPALSTWNSTSSRARDEDNGGEKDKGGRNWSSTQNLNQEVQKNKTDAFSSGLNRPKISWTSTPDLGGLNDSTTAVTVSLKLPRKKTAPLPLDTGQDAQNVVTLRRPSASPPPPPVHLTINKNDSLAERVRKMQLLKAQNSFEKESSQEREKERRSSSRSKEEEPKKPEKTEKPRPSTKDSDMNFLIQVKNARANKAKEKPPIRGGPSKEEKDGEVSDSSMDDDTLSTAGTTTTETTLVDQNTKEYQDQIDSLKDEIETLRKRCERVEKEKSDILLRRLANLDTTTSKITGRSSELLKMQQKVNDLMSQNEDLKDDKKSLALRVKEIEAELESRPSPELAARQVEQLRSKLLAAETLCEELMDENEDMKKELRELEEEIEEMQDNFREDQADEYTSLRRELEQTTKNCRVLSFKLKKTERRAEGLEQEKQEQEKKLLEIVGGQVGLDRVAKIKELEQEVVRANEVALRLQRELQEANGKIAQQPPANQKKAPPLGTIGKASSADGKLSRASLTRGGSQEDPQQLLRDLQDSLEREADLREQLKNAEEEAINLRKKASRVEDDNESLLLQLKKMATKARTRKLSPTAPINRLSIDASIEKDEGISDEEDPAELRILLELNEQEAAVLRRKVEELELEGDSLKNQVRELTEKIASSSAKSTPIATKKNSTAKSSGLAEEKIKVLESEIGELRKKLIEKERDCERLHAELSVVQKRPKGSLIKSKSLDSNSEQQNVDLKRQLQVIEQEASVLRTKTQTLEAENEKLQAENKKLQLLRGARTLKSDKTADQNAEKMTKLENELKEALAKVKEFETSKDEKSEKRVSFGGSGTKKDAEILKFKQEELDKIKINLTKTEKERDKLAETLKELKQDAIKSFKPRTPKRITDLTTKLQMKRMVEDLENEIGEMFVVMKNAELDKTPAKASEKKDLEKTISDIRSKLSQAEAELTNEKNRLQTEITKLKDQNTKLTSEKTSLLDKNKLYESEKSKTLAEVTSLTEEKKKLEAQVTKLNADLKTASSKQTAMSDCMKKIEDLKKEIDDKDKELDKMKKQSETVSRLEQDKTKLIKELGDKTKKINELEKKLKDSEEKCKRIEKQLSARKDKLAKLEKELSDEKEQTGTLTNIQKRKSVDLTSENDDLKIKLMNAETKLLTMECDWKEKITDHEAKVSRLEANIAAKDNHIQQLEDTVKDSSNQKSDDAVSSAELIKVQEKLESALTELTSKEQELATAKGDLSSKQQELSKLQEDLTSTKKDLAKLENDKKDVENNVKVQKKEAGYWEGKASELETDLQAERKKVERMRVNHDRDCKNKEAELATLKGKLRTLEQTSGAGTKKISEMKQDFEEKLKKLEHELAVEKQEYEELTAKYEILEEEHVVTKAKLTIDKEAAQGELVQIQRELSCATAELKALRETYNNESDTWVKEKLELQEKLSVLEDRLCGGGWEVEKVRLQAKLEQKEREAKNLAEERDVTLHQNDILRREIDEARTKLDDYEKVHKVQRNLAAENADMEAELKNLQNKLNQADRMKKNDIVQCKLRYEAQMQTMQEEMVSLQGQVSRFKRERDTFKQMLDSTQNAMRSGDNSTKNKRASITSMDELEDAKMRVATLEQQVNCMEDELCEARMEASKLKTELISEKSTSEVKLAEMQSKLNEFEEDRLLSSGRTKIPGMRTRMELAWQKERDEQQRLLQETSTLARDLRQTLFEVERERDKERLDMKRRVDQLKRTTEEETDENKKKVTELQCDLLELRDAHAKLRTTNEKLRREKEKNDRDREQNKLLVASLKRSQQDDDRKISYLLDQIEELMKQSPELFKGNAVQNPAPLVTPTPPRRNRSSKSRSREATPESGISDSSIQSTLARLQKATEELKASRLIERQRRQVNMKRAASTEPRDTSLIVTTVTPRSANTRNPSLKKRSISLEQTTKDAGTIWKTEEDSMSSLQSLDADIDPRTFTMQRDTSLDSRLSGGSTQSDVLPAGDKKKKGLFGKLKKLTKSRSIDDQAGPDVAEFRPIGAVSQGSDSDMSAAGSKRDIRGRLSDMFSRKGQSSRSSSKEPRRELSTPLPERADTSSQQRPPSRNGSSTNLRQTTPTSTTSSSRTKSTPAMQRKPK